MFFGEIFRVLNQKANGHIVEHSGWVVGAAEFKKRHFASECAVCGIYNVQIYIKISLSCFTLNIFGGAGKKL